MIANKRRDTQPELRIRRLLHAGGLRFRVDFAPLVPRRRADIVFTKRRLVVFVDGCFWHGCPEHFVLPETNREFWREKIAANVRRDAETTGTLMAAGWAVVRVWEHIEPEESVRMIRAVLDHLEEQKWQELSHSNGDTSKSHGTHPK